MVLVCCAVSVISSCAIISLGKRGRREMVALLLLHFDVRFCMSASRCREMVCSE